jgi:hypothetical protein
MRGRIHRTGFLFLLSKLLALLLSLRFFGFGGPAANCVQFLAYRAAVLIARLLRGQIRHPVFVAVHGVLAFMPACAFYYFSHLVFSFYFLLFLTKQKRFNSHIELFAKFVIKDGIFLKELIRQPVNFICQANDQYRLFQALTGLVGHIVIFRFTVKLILDTGLRGLKNLFVF